MLVLRENKALSTYWTFENSKEPFIQKQNKCWRQQAYFCFDTKILWDVISEKEDWRPIRRPIRTELSFLWMETLSCKLTAFALSHNLLVIIGSFLFFTVIHIIPRVSACLGSNSFLWLPYLLFLQKHLFNCFTIKFCRLNTRKIIFYKVLEYFKFKRILETILWL